MNRFFKVLLILVMIIPVTPHMVIHATSNTMLDIQDTTEALIEEFNDEYELLLEGEVDVLATHSSDSELEVETELIYEVNAEDSELQDDAYMYEIMQPAMKSSESCHVVTSGRFPNQTGVGGLGGAPWVLCSDGVLEVGGGFIDQSNWWWFSPWSDHSSQISRIVFTEPITAGTSLQGLFAHMWQVIEIEGLSYFDTSQVTNMSQMFTGASNLVSLDLSSFDTSRVTNMSWMFNNMTSLRELTLGSQFIFRNSPGLPAVTPTHILTGRWQSVGTGTLENPAGDFVFTSEQLMSQYNPQTMADTFVWQRWPENPQVIAEGQFENQAGANGLEGAPWRLYENRTLVVDAGFIESVEWENPWHVHQSQISRIVFTGPIRAGVSLRGLFAHMWQVTEIEGLGYFDTSLVEDMSGMFSQLGNLTSLDLSNWNTSNVTDMNHMFVGMYRTSINVSNFNTSNVTDMSWMFADVYRSNIDVSSWDTSNVTDMSGMFSHMYRTSIDVSNFNTSNVTDMSSMFSGLFQLTSLDVSNFDTSNVTDMSSMFSGLSRLTSLDVSNFDTSNVTDMSNMFSGLSRLTSLDVSNFNTNNVTNMSWMFSVMNMHGMFFGPSRLTSLDVSDFDTSNVTDMSSMFSGLSQLTSLDVSNFDTSNVTDMNNMFSGLSRLTSLDVSNFNTNNVTNMSWMFSAMDMSGMFSGLSQLTSLDVSNFDTSNVTDMSSMFSGLSQLTSLDVSNFDTSNVTGMSSMFSSTYRLAHLDVSNFNTSNVTNMSWMFSSARSLTNLDLSNWNTSRVAVQWGMSNMFSGMTSLRELALGSQFQFRNSPGLPVVTPTHIFNGMWRNVGTGTLENPAGDFVFTSAQLMSQYNPQTMADTFVWQRWPENPQVIAEGQFENQAGANGLEGAPWRLYENRTLVVDAGFINWTGWPSPWNAHQSRISRVVFTGPITAGSSLRSLFSNMNSLIKIEGLSYFDTSQVTDMSNMFSSWSSQLTTLDVSDWDTGRVTDMHAMFSNASSLTTLDLSNWNTSNVENMHAMFSNTSSLTTLDLSNWNTGRVTDMSNMFSSWSGSQLTTLDVSNWDTGRVTDMHAMFSDVSSLTTLDVSNWDTSRVTNMHAMFYNVSSLTTLDVSNWDTGRVTSMNAMFSGVSDLASLDVSNWNTSNVEDMHAMFHNASRLTSLDLSSWNTSRVRDMSHMFSYAASLETLDLSSFNTLRVTDMSFMFAGIIWRGGGGEDVESQKSLDTLNIDTSHVDDVSDVYGLISSLTSIDLSSFNTFQVISMEGMFSGTTSLRNLDVSNFDTSDALTMRGMFLSTGLERLDLSNFDTSRVWDMSFMFASKPPSLCGSGAEAEGTSKMVYMSDICELESSLTSLDLSSFDTSNLHEWGMSQMFYGTYALRSLTLGNDFEFINSNWGSPDLPEIDPTAEFTGYWQNIGDGTVGNPTGNYVFTSAELMEQFSGNTMADTFIWQPVERETDPIPIPRYILRELIAEAEARIQANYTPRSWGDMQSMLTFARSVYNNPNLQDAQYDEAVVLLRARLDALVLR